MSHSTITVCRLLLVGSTMNGVTGAITMAAPSLVSVKWFPTSERTIATSFAALSGYVGNAMSFVTGMQYILYKPFYIVLTNCKR